MLTDNHIWHCAWAIKDNLYNKFVWLCKNVCSCDKKGTQTVAVKTTQSAMHDHIPVMSHTISDGKSAFKVCIRPKTLSSADHV